MKCANATPLTTDARQDADDYTAANERIENIGECRRRIAEIETAMNDELAEIKARHEAEAAEYKAQAAISETLLRDYCDSHRDELTNHGKAKSHRFPAGEVAWRKSPPAVEIAKKGVTALIATLKQMKLARFVRTREELDKEAILADPDAVAKVPGLKVRSAGERFEVKPFEAQLSEHHENGR